MQKETVNNDVQESVLNSANVASEDAHVVEIAPDGIPNYMHETYDWAYVNPKNVERLDNEFVVYTLLFLNAGRLKRYYLNHIKPGDHVWQVAHVYGDLVKQAASKVGDNGLFHLSDVTPIQAEHGKRKLKNIDNSKVFLVDAADFDAGQQYDIVCNFFLLHEVPDTKKRDVIANMIKKVKPDGKMIFVDYHKPKWWNPIGWILVFVNKFLEPYAFSLWDKEISEFGLDTQKYHIEKSTICGGVYQTLCVTLKR